MLISAFIHVTTGQALEVGQNAKLAGRKAISDNANGSVNSVNLHYLTNLSLRIRLNDFIV